MKHSVPEQSGLNTLLPEAIEGASIPLGPRDLLIVAGGFEDRRRAVLSALEVEVGCLAVVVRYRPEQDANRHGEMEQDLADLGISIVCRENELVFDRFSPLGFSRSLGALLQRKNPVRVVIDISCMSKLLILLALDCARRASVAVDLFYASALEYGPTEIEFKNAVEADDFQRPSIQIAAGVGGVFSAPGLASVAMHGQPVALVAFMSFNEQLVQALVNTIYPSRLILINGRPPVLSWREKAMRFIHQRLLEEWPSERALVETCGIEEETLLASTLDYRETVRMLDSLYWILGRDHKVVVAPTGSKMQAVGCFLAKQMHQDIHIEYPTPQSHDFELLSSGVGTVYRLSLASLGELVERLRAETRRRLLVFGQ